jgi:hypothetical protein
MTESVSGPSASNATPAGDDPTISDAELLYRRLSDSGPNMIAVDLLTGEQRPSTGAFKPDPDGISVYRDSAMKEEGISVADLVTRPGNLIVSLSVGDVRSIWLGVRDDKWPADVPDPEHPRNAAHALIIGAETLGKHEQKRRLRELVAVPSLTFVYP